jgi:hypothetical protein
MQGDEGVAGSPAADSDLSPRVFLSFNETQSDEWDRPIRRDRILLACFPKLTLEARIAVRLESLTYMFMC